MATYNGRSLTPLAGVNLKAREGFIRFETPDRTPVTTSGERVLYCNSSNQLVFDSGVTTTVLGSSGSIVSFSLNDAYDDGSTLTVDAAAVQFAGSHATNNVVELRYTGSGTGNMIDIQNDSTGSDGSDIIGTDNTWALSSAGALTCISIADSATNATLQVNGNGTGGVNIGSTSTGSITLGAATTLSSALLFTITGTAGSTYFDITAGDATITDGSLAITDNDQAAALVITNNTYSTTTAGIVDINSSSLTTGYGITFVANGVTSGTMLYLESSAAGFSGNYILCHDGAATDFSVGLYGAVTIAGNGGSDVLTLTAGDAVISDGSFTLTDADNGATFTVTNNTATSASVVVLAGSGVFTGSTTTSFATLTASGLTTGTVLYVPAAALTTGKVIDLVAAAATDGILVNVTGGGVNMTATGRLGVLDMGAATVGRALEVLTSGAYTGAGVVTVVADSATTSGATVGQGIVAVSADALTTGTMLDVTSTSIVLTSGRIADFSHISGNITGILNKSGDFFNISSARTVTTGTVADDYDMLNLIRTSVINGAGSFSATGSVVYVENAVTNTSGTVTDTVNGVQVVMDSLGTGSALHITHSAVAAVVVDIVSTATTTGKLIDMSDANALTSGIALHIASSATAITGAGRLIYSNHSGATSTSAILNEFASAAADGTTVFKVTASAALTGIVVDISAAALTTGKAVDISDLAAITTGKAIHIDATGVTQTDGILVHIDSASTALTSTGRLFLSDHTGVTTVSGVLNEFKSAANDETVVVRLNGTALTTGVMLDITGPLVTTGTLLDIGDADALTTGKILNLVSNSADSSARNMIFIHNDNAAATAAVPLALRNDGLTGTGTKFTRQMSLGDGTKTNTVWLSTDATTPNGNLSGTAGDICLNGPSSVPFYCTGTTSWTALA